MKHTQKIALVPLEEWEKLKEKNSKQPPKEIVTVNQPVAQMRQTVPSQIPLSMKKETVPQIRKQKKSTLNQTLKQNVKKMKRNKNKKLELPEKTMKRYKIRKVLKKISPENKDKAQLLLQNIYDFNILKWKESGEIKYKGKIIPRSNIVSLVKNVLNKNDDSEPPGIKIFYKVLKKINIPKYLINNEKALGILSTYDSKYDVNTWRPPGELVVKKKKKKKKK